jgi:hypothetical protein
LYDSCRVRKCLKVDRSRLIRYIESIRGNKTIDGEDRLARAAWLHVIRSVHELDKAARD